MKKKTTTKKAAAVKPKTNQPVTIDAETIDFMLEEIITNAMALQALWQAVTGGRDK